MSTAGEFQARTSQGRLPGGGGRRWSQVLTFLEGLHQIWDSALLSVSVTGTAHEVLATPSRAVSWAQKWPGP